MKGVKREFRTEDGSVWLMEGCSKQIVPQLQCKFDALLTDPPYGIVNQFGENTGNGTRTMQFEWDTPTITADVLEILQSALAVCSKRAGCFVFCGGDQFGDILSLVRSAKFTAKPAAWVKECPPPAGKGNWWPSAFEFAVYGYRPGAYFGDDDPKRSNVFVCDSYRYGQPGKVDHPTQKPLKLIRQLVKAIAPEGGIVLDCFGGSGSTAVACANLGRRCVSIERVPKYFDLQVERVKAELSRTVLLEPAPKITQRSLLGDDA